MTMTTPKILNWMKIRGYFINEHTQTQFVECILSEWNAIETIRAVHVHGIHLTTTIIDVDLNHEWIEFAPKMEHNKIHFILFRSQLLLTNRAQKSNERTNERKKNRTKIICNNQVHSISSVVCSWFSCTTDIGVNVESSENSLIEMHLLFRLRYYYIGLL